MILRNVSKKIFYYCKFQSALSYFVWQGKCTDLGETFQARIFNDRDHDGKVKIRQTGAWNQAICNHFSLVFCVKNEQMHLSKMYANSWMQVNNRDVFFSDFLLPSSYLALLDFIIVIPIIKTTQYGRSSRSVSSDLCTSLVKLEHFTK